MIALVVASASLATAVIPTSVPLVAFSSTALAAGVVVADRARVEFVHVVDRDRERLVGCTNRRPKWLGP